jgi:drug/metabolite transporter (DMT)-like permease
MDLSIPLSIICAMAWGIQAIFLKMAMKETPLYSAILTTLIINFLALVLFIGVGSEKGFSEFYNIPISIFFYFMIAGFLNYFLGRGFYYSSFRFIGVTLATSISATYPLLTVGFAILALGEGLALRQFCGIGLTLTGVYLLLMRGKR